MIDLVDLDAERRLWPYGYVNGKDGLIHKANARSVTVCGMGRAQKDMRYVEHGPPTCFWCLVR